MSIPAWIWAASAAGLIVVLVAEVVLTGLPGHRPFTTRSALGWVAVYVSLAALFGIGVGVSTGWVTAGQFYAGYLTEYSLSLDNLLIFYLIMSWFAVPSARQPRALLLGIGLALALRSVLIVAGVAAVSRFGWLFYLLGGILVWTAVGLVTSRPGDQPERHARLMSRLTRRLRPAGADHGHRVTGRPMLSALLLPLVIGLADVLFAVDSIPAVFGITTSAALIVACNAFALMGLRQLYALLAQVLDRIVYLNAGLGIVCAFIGGKLLLHALRGSGVSWAPDIPAWLSVLVVAAVLLITVLAGMIRSGRAGRERAMLERRFAIVDIDGNGVWQHHDYQQLTRCLCEAFGHAADSATEEAVAAGQRALFDALLSHMDADGDEQITRDEFIAAVGRAVKDRAGFDAAAQAAARTLVRVADGDGNGTLDAAEYTRLAAAYGARADEAARAFDLIDQDRNGVLDTAELTLAINRFFTSRAPDARGSFAFGRLRPAWLCPAAPARLRGRRGEGGRLAGTRAQSAAWLSSQPFAVPHHGAEAEIRVADDQVRVQPRA